MKKLIVPKDLGRFFESYVDMIGDDTCYFEITSELVKHYHMNRFKDETKRFIFYYMMEISEVISGKREYEVEK